ncbi:tribbles3-like [Scleropages formosus]|uniref:Tribbles pseudokinase 3 n=1 Tax=Scleropages formosus TaxID=113540 RepID=A0A0P7UCA9_SCLFO|nr:tribbles homolog 2-like [Scleropages formosus]KPP57733.1 tribbles3-like [Scleropages formosus]
MSVNMQSGPYTLPLRLKRVDFEEPLDGDAPKRKRPRLSQPPSPGLAPCLRLRTQSLSAGGPEQPCASRIGPYILLEMTEGTHTHRAVHSVTEKEYTCKVFSMSKYQQLIAPYARLQPHDNVSHIAEVVTGERSAYVFFERNYGDMHSYVRTCKRLAEDEAAHLFGQMARAVAHCHERGVVLRDLKLRKFVFADQQRTKLVLQDLEDSCILKGEDDSLTDKHGCPAYVGPEILNSRHSYSGKAADVWSLGVVLYTMLVGRYPFQDAEPAALFGKIRRGVFTVPDSLSPRAKCLVRCMLRRTPSERLEAAEILLHPWLSSGGMAPTDTHLAPRSHTDQVVPDFGGNDSEDLL